MFNIEFNSDTLRVFYDGGLTYLVVTNAVFRDPSAWYHVCVVSNTTIADPNKTLIYVNGVLQTITGTPPPLNYTAVTGTTSVHRIGFSPYFDGYLTEINFIDGQALTPSSFGRFDSSTGVWSPIRYTGTYGTNGFYLKFADASAATATAIGKDSSGNGNNWTPSGISVTSGVTYDSMIDVPVSYADGANGRGNYAVLNPLDKLTTATLAAANLETTSAAAQNIIGSMSMDSGSWYWEIAYSAATASQLVGVYKTSAITATVTPTTAVIGLRFNANTGALDYTVDGTTYTSIATGLTGGGYFPYAGSLTNAKVIYANFGQRPFAYTPPAGFRALNTNNLPTPVIVNPANYMAATTYTGNASARTIANTTNGVAFQPDLVWIKSRTPAATNHVLFDSLRGANIYAPLSSTTIGPEVSNSQTLTAFGTTGFSLGTDTTLVNANANSYIAWQWKEAALAGVDVVIYTGTGSARGVAHNLGAVPAMIIVKSRGSIADWCVYHSSISATNRLLLSQTNGSAADSTMWNNTAPTSSSFSVGSNAGVNASAINYVAYCFAEIAGFSKFGSYTGNGSADGPFVFCGFRPRFVMIKRTDTSGFDWFVYDSVRDTFNVLQNNLRPNTAGIESAQTANYIDLTSNGFKLRGDNTGSINNTSGTYIFAAFAEAPSKYALAR